MKCSRLYADLRSGIAPPLAKLIRTIQSESNSLVVAKEFLRNHYRKLFSVPHDPSFSALKFVPDDLPGCYLDVGANRGQSIESIKAFKARACIVSLEPNPLLAARLQADYRRRDDVTILPFGLAERAEPERILYVPVYKNVVYDGLASFDRETAADWINPRTVYWYSPHKLKLLELTCVTRRLDDLNVQPIFIKITVQGYQHQAVTGGLATIARYEPILLILDFHWDSPLGEVLREAGYEQYLFDAEGFYRATPSWVLFSYLMTRKRAATVRRSTREGDARAGVGSGSGRRTGGRLA